MPPGGTFSFNGAIREITVDKGYQVADAITNATVGRDIGGGVCQVSTTVFRAALEAGMPMVEWWPHTFRLLGYEAQGWRLVLMRPFCNLAAIRPTGVTSGSKTTPIRGCWWNRG